MFATMPVGEGILAVDEPCIMLEANVFAISSSSEERACWLVVVAFIVNQSGSVFLDDNMLVNATISTKYIH